jgi:hypothetical protein
MADGSQRILDCLMHSFANCIGLGILDSHWHLMNVILDKNRLEWTTGEFTPLVEKIHQSGQG